MKFALKEVDNPNVHRYSSEELQIAYNFSKKAYTEFGNFIKSLIIFGSAARKEVMPGGDIDILIIIDDISLELSPELVETYRIIMEQLIAETSERLHVTTLKITSFWDYIRNSDPIGINILRDGYALLDSGFFDPLQALLIRGRIRPTPESVWTYFSRAPRTLQNSKWHILQGVMDLYWAVIDAAHAALMSLGEVPPSPKHVDDMMIEKMVKPKLISKEYATTMNKFYILAKKISNREIIKLSGKQYDDFYKEANQFVKTMQNFIETNKKI
ncbi:nucleotidyltransferase domain-containing protein [Candidatus Woesearchaeota archaeon]|nr:nucleotidyltransferase domain-containing protein [Candidatus Woesearchaeota archaeon]